jgi:multidrug efflux pump subunit AcrA (membrane-fusion protein)
MAELNRLELTYRKSELQIEQARRDQTVAGITKETKQAEVEAADLSIKRRELVSSIDGEVIAVYKHIGEWVPPGDPVFRVIRLDRLRVEGRLNVADYSPSEINGRSVNVEVALEHGRKERFTGKIVFVDPKVQSGGAYNIKAEVENREKNGQWVLRPGLPATMAINVK